MGDESNLGLEPLEACPHDLPDSADVPAVELTAGESALDPLEEEHLKRLRRKRESAATTRNRKEAYIEELEAKVAALSNSVQQLQSEKFAAGLDALPPGLTISLNGPALELTQTIESLTKGQLQSVALASLAILLVLCLMFASIKVGLLAMLSPTQTILTTLIVTGFVARHGPEALRHLRLLAKRKAQALDEGSDQAASSLELRWACRLSVALHRANARNLRSALGVDLRQQRAELAADLAG